LLGGMQIPEREKQRPARRTTPNRGHRRELPVQPSDSAAVRLSLADANPAAEVSGEARSEATANYFIGNDPALWRTAVPVFERVRYHGVYPGIDLVYYGNQRQLEYDFVVAQDADAD